MTTQPPPPIARLPRRFVVNRNGTLTLVTLDQLTPPERQEVSDRLRAEAEAAKAGTTSTEGKAP